MAASSFGVQYLPSEVGASCLYRSPCSLAPALQLLSSSSVGFLFLFFSFFLIFPFLDEATFFFTNLSLDLHGRS